MSRNHLGTLLSNVRLEAGVTLDALAQSSGLSKEAVCRILKSQSCSLGAAVKLGRALDVHDHLTVMCWAQDRVEAAGLSCRVYVAPGKDG